MGSCKRLGKKCFQGGYLKLVGFFKDCQSELRSWNSVRTTSTYYLYYGLLSQLLLPVVGRFVALRLQQTPINVPLITMSNIGVIASSTNTSRPPLWSLEDLKRMPELEHFLGAVSEPVVFRHYICGSYLFLGKLTLTANFSRFAITREEAKDFLEKIVTSLLKVQKNLNEPPKG